MKRNPLETAVIAVSSLLVASSLGVLVWQGSADRLPPSLETRVDSVVARGGSHIVHITVRNLGDETATSAVLRGRLRAGDAIAAEATVVIDWIPGRSRARAALLFDEDPGGRDIDASIIGYTER